MLVDDPLSPGNLAFASVAILLDDLTQVIRVVNIDVVELRRAGVYIPWDAQVHQEQCAISARRHRPLHDIAPQNRFIRANRRHDHIRSFQRAIPLTPPYDLSAELIGKLARPASRAVHEIALPASTIPELRNHGLADLT